MDIREFVDARGASPFARWFDDLDARAAVKVTIALARMEQGNLSNAKGGGRGFKSTGSIGDPDIGCISGGTETR